MFNVLKILVLVLLVGCSAPFEAADLDAVGGDTGEAGEPASAGANAGGDDSGSGGSSSAGGSGSVAGKPSMGGSPVAGGSPGGASSSGGQPVAGTSTGGTTAGSSGSAGAGSAGASGGTPAVCMDHTCGFTCGDVEPWVGGKQYGAGDLVYTYCHPSYGDGSSGCVGEVHRFRCVDPGKCDTRQPAAGSAWDESVWADDGLCPQ